MGILYMGIMKRFAIFSIGTTGITDEEIVKRVRFVNILSIAIGIAILIIGPSMSLFFKWRFSVILALSIEFIVNGLVLVLNHFKKHLAAKLLLYCLQCVAIPYFGILLSRILHLEFVIILQIAVIYRIFKEPVWRKVALAAALMELLILEYAYDYGGNQEILPVSNTGAFAIHMLVVLAIIGITIIVCNPYVKSNDDNAELKKANRFIKIFVAQVTHELRTRLDNIHQAAQLLRKETQRHEELKQIEPLPDILFTASSDARNIVNNVLDMAEIESGKIPGTVNEAFRVRPFFEKMLEVYKAIGREEQIQWQLSIDMPEVIISDPLNINQIVGNLLANAIKFGFKGSTIHVEVRKCNAEWELKISNTGQGIPAEKIPFIFDPFVTGKTGLMQGTGLGLYIVKNKVASLNGTIGVQSKPGGYTVFTVTMPLVEGKFRNLPERDETKESTIKGSADLNNIHVLMAEDSKLTAFLLSRFLTDIGCRVTIVNNGKELLEAAQQANPGGQPDIIILDCHMPVLSGEQTIRQLKKIPELSHIPIIVTTGDLFSDTLDKMLEAGADTYLKKPIDHLDLHRTIGLYLKKQS
jgi:two-component system, sensor histidine kinase